jgi:hypothetical protein
MAAHLHGILPIESAAFIAMPHCSNRTQFLPKLRYDFYICNAIRPGRAAEALWTLLERLSMRSHLEIPDTISGTAVDHRSLRLEDYGHYERLARVERAALIGELLADGILWTIGIPNRVIAALRMRAERTQARRQSRRHVPVAQ